MCIRDRGSIVATIFYRVFFAVGLGVAIISYSFVSGGEDPSLLYIAIVGVVWFLIYQFLINLIFVNGSRYAWILYEFGNYTLEFVDFRFTLPTLWLSKALNFEKHNDINLEGYVLVMLRKKMDENAAFPIANFIGIILGSVSYTHLTLPTILRV